MKLSFIPTLSFSYGKLSVINKKILSPALFFGEMRLNTVDNKDRNFQNPKGYQLNYLFKLIFMPHLFWAIGALVFLLITVLITLSLPIMVRYLVD